MRNSCISSKNTNLNSIQDAYKDFLNDPILTKRNSLLIELSNIIKSNDRLKHSNQRILDLPAS